MLVEIEQGALYETEIMDIEPGVSGKPGVMAGVIYYGPGFELGTVNRNTDEGIFGSVNQQFYQNLQSEAIEVGYRQDVTKGPAVVRSSVSGEVKDYEIEIQRIDRNGKCGAINSFKFVEIMQNTNVTFIKLTG